MRVSEPMSRDVVTIGIGETCDEAVARMVERKVRHLPVLGEAVRFLVAEVGVDHVDMNFGCPVPKVTRKGGGSALPVRTALLRNILRVEDRTGPELDVIVSYP